MRKIILILLFLLALIACEKYSGEPEEEPYIEWFSFPDTIYTLSDYDILIEVKVINHELMASNSQGDIEFTPEIEGFTGKTLFDGHIPEEDIIPGDGIFSGILSSKDFENVSGELTAVVRILEGPVIRELQKPQTSPKPSRLITEKSFFVINENRNTPPEIFNLSHPDTVSVDSFQNDILTVTVTDEDGISDLTGVFVNVYYPGSAAPDLTLELTESDIDMGPLPVFVLDLNPADVAKLGRGKYTLLVYAVDSKGQRSNELYGEIEYVSSAENLPPQIISVNAPDSVVATGGFLLLSAEVHDPDGLADIDKVLFNSFKPDGSSALSNPFYLYDDGSEVLRNGVTSGDSIKNDGIYTIKILLPVNADKGTYHFIFEAIDKQGNRSNQIDHALKIN
ncbi:hypothetical protein ACFL4T_14785 [candidate division KSB1 bacterium]